MWFFLQKPESSLKHEGGSVDKVSISFRHGMGNVMIFLLVFAMVSFCGCYDCMTFNGIFLDSPVEGLSYSTATLDGLTDADGTFQYKFNETVTFSLCGVVLGSATGADLITPVDLVDGGTTENQTVINIACLLQSLDADGNNNNGIQITEAIRNIIESKQPVIDFNQSTADFRADISVASLLAALNTANVFTNLDTRDRTLRSAAKAHSHLEASLSERVVVKTGYGRLRGYGPTADTWQWVGVPYAKPPVGDLRWRAPQPPETWIGNYGQFDLIAALSWIQENIEAFGGDSSNVTIFGESGGGGKSISLMASPLADDLFDKVICESGTAESAMTVLNGLPLAETMMTMWANFAYTGDPSIPGVVQWTPYTSAEDNYLEINATSQTMQSGLDSELELIDPDSGI